MGKGRASPCGADGCFSKKNCGVSRDLALLPFLLPLNLFCDLAFAPLPPIVLSRSVYSKEKRERSERARGPAGLQCPRSPANAQSFLLRAEQQFPALSPPDHALAAASSPMAHRLLPITAVAADGPSLMSFSLSVYGIMTDMYIGQFSRMT